MGYLYQHAETWILNQEHFPVTGHIIKVHIVYPIISGRKFKKLAFMNGCKHKIAKHFFNHSKSVRSWGSIVHIGLSYRLDGLRFESWYRKRYFSSTKCQRLALGPNQSPIEWVPGVLSQGSGHHAKTLTTYLT
jgi:hypothetical protein